MAEPQGQKRQRAEESSQSDNQPLSKNVKTASELELDAWYSWTYPPEFYDRLSKINLTSHALPRNGFIRHGQSSQAPASCLAFNAVETLSDLRDTVAQI
ncbi:hypothetical protein SEPCBS119000_002038 [Sporothrix epigloea]|uniref:Uncharacterized protein n=1 Tax=Sporothrix epigloea TaxID=1892477 RepID=A0ABP0DE04_9PEZI